MTAGDLDAGHHDPSTWGALPWIVVIVSIVLWMTTSGRRPADRTEWVIDTVVRTTLIMVFYVLATALWSCRASPMATPTGHSARSSAALPTL